MKGMGGCESGDDRGVRILLFRNYGNVGNSGFGNPACYENERHRSWMVVGDDAAYCID